MEESPQSYISLPTGGLWSRKKFLGRHTPLTEKSGAHLTGTIATNQL